MIRIYNTLNRAKETFVPIEPGRVRMYVCGMTVYDYCHIGHARLMVVFDVVQRWLRASGFQVTYVRNITDIDDKIIRRAAENGEPIGKLTERFIRYMDEDAAALGVQKPDHEPRATGYIPQMLALIGELESNGLAYRVPSGDVNYPVRKFPGYGKLSGKSLDELRAGERVEIDREKQDPLDFVLWKHSQADEPAWQSPFGDGRPGWHIECSAMSTTLLGRTFDIHGGGEDLQFPHHENEIAQSEGAHGGRFVNYWMHNGFVRVDDEKMSKSLGNFFTIREVLAKYDPEVVRFFILRAHYRSPLNYSDKHLDEARSGLARLYTALKGGTGAPGRDRLGRAARRALSRGDGRRLQYARGGRRAVRARERGQSERVGRSGEPAAAARWRARPARPPRRGVPAGRAGRRMDGRADRSSDRGAERGAEGQGLRRGRPDPEGAAGRRHRPRGLASRHDLAERLTGAAGCRPAAVRSGYSLNARSRPRIDRLTKLEPLWFDGENETR